MAKPAELDPDNLEREHALAAGKAARWGMARRALIGASINPDNTENKALRKEVDKFLAHIEKLGLHR